MSIFMIRQWLTSHPSTRWSYWPIWAVNANVTGKDHSKTGHTYRQLIGLIFHRQNRWRVRTDGVLGECAAAWGARSLSFFTFLFLVLLQQRGEIHSWSQQLGECATCHHVPLREPTGVNYGSFIHRWNADWPVCAFTAHLLENQDLISGLQVLQLVSNQDPGLVLQNTTNTPARTIRALNAYGKEIWGWEDFLNVFWKRSLINAVTKAAFILS